MNWRHAELQPATSMVVAIVATFFALGGAAHGAASAMPSAGGVIHSCYAKRGGNLRLIAAGKRCHRGEKALAFSQTGPQGARGTQGTPGPQGPTGNQGPAGPLTTTLPSGETLRGEFYISVDAGVGQQAVDAVSFGLSLPSVPSVGIVGTQGGTTPGCSGAVTSPTAAPRHLCLYEYYDVNSQGQGLQSCRFGSPVCATADPFGADLVATAAAAGPMLVTGTWAVTAP